MIDSRIQPIVSSTMAAVTISWPIVRRRKSSSRIVSATILTEAIASAVPMNSVVTRR